MLFRLVDLSYSYCQPLRLRSKSAPRFSCHARMVYLVLVRVMWPHTGCARTRANKSLDVFDLNSMKLLKRVPTGTTQEVVVDSGHVDYYISGNNPGRTVIVNSKTLTATGQVPLSAATDMIVYKPLTGQIHECNDTAAEEWVIDLSANCVVATIRLKGRGVEDPALGPGHQQLFQALKGPNTIVVIDPADNKILHQHPLALDRGPHGIAIVPKSDGLFVACNGSLVLRNRSTGTILDRATIAPRLDEMTSDPWEIASARLARFPSYVRMTTNWSRRGVLQTKRALAASRLTRKPIGSGLPTAKAMNVPFMPSK